MNPPRAGLGKATNRLDTFSHLPGPWNRAQLPSRRNCVHKWSLRVTATIVCIVGILAVLPYPTPIAAAEGSDNWTPKAEPRQSGAPNPSRRPSSRPWQVDSGWPAPSLSGFGRRIVWHRWADHVWLIDEHNKVVLDYPVTDLDWKTPPGQYKVHHKTRTAYSNTAAGQLRLNHFVAFYKRCSSCAWIGFHAIPVTARGNPIQPESALADPAWKSDGCIRQSPGNAAALYRFAEVGTKVVVIG